MIRVSTKGRYGLNAMFAIAYSQANAPLSINQISKDLSIPLTYLEQIFATLKKAGYVKSLRGAKGGYILAMEAKDIMVYDLLQKLEGEILPVHCKDPGNCKDHKTTFCCAGEIVWNKINLAMKDAIGDYSLADMIKEYNG